MIAIRYLGYESKRAEVIDGFGGVCCLADPQLGELSQGPRYIGELVPDGSRYSEPRCSPIYVPKSRLDQM